MAEARKIVIEIKSASEGEKSQLERHLKPKKSKEQIEAENREKSIHALQVNAYQHTMGLIKTSINMSKNRYFNMTENYILENEVNNFMTVAGNTASVVNSAIIGAKMGVSAGPAGVVAGVVIGVGFNLANKAINYQNTLANYYSSLNATNMQTEWSAKRAGLWDEGRGTEN